MKKLFIDVETTGLDPEKCSIIEIGMIIEYDNLHEEYKMNAQPFTNDIVSMSALETCKKTVKDLEAYQHPRDMYLELKSILDVHINRYDKKDKFMFIAYNAQFDYGFLRNFFLKNSDKYFGAWVFFPPIDVMNLAAFYLRKTRHELENFNLATIAKHFKVQTQEAENFHDALYDTKTTKLIYEQLHNLQEK